MCPALVLGNMAQRQRAEMFNGGLELSMYASVTRKTTFSFFAPLSLQRTKLMELGSLSVMPVLHNLIFAWPLEQSIDIYYVSQ